MRQQQKITALALFCMFVSPMAMAQEVKYAFDMFEDNVYQGRYTTTVTPEDDHLAIDVIVQRKNPNMFSKSPVYFAYRSQEKWQNGCIQHMQGGSFVNGIETQFRAVMEEGGLALHSNDTHLSLKNCARTLPYWSYQLMRDTTHILLPDEARIVAVDVTARDTPQGKQLQVRYGNVAIYLGYHPETLVWTSYERIENGKITLFVPIAP